MDAPGFDTLIKKDADTADTLALIVRTINDFYQTKFVRECAKELCAPGTPRNECLRNVFDYALRNIKFILDTAGRENVFTPALTIIKGEGDCKKITVFIASVLKAAGIEPVLKHVVYTSDDPWTHIYVIVPNPTLPNYIAIDPADNSEFGKEVSYKSSTLYFLDGKKMELHQMGSPNWNENSFSTGCHSMTADLDHIGAAVFRSPFNTTQTHKGKFSLAEQRGAFLKLIENNLHGAATNLVALTQSNPEQLNVFWKNFGGSPDSLKEAILKGAAKKQVGNIFEDIGNYAAAAVPIVNAATNLVTTIAPNSGIAKSFQLMSHTATAHENSAIPGAIPLDAAGHSYPPYQPSAGSFFSPVGFIFKSALLISMLHVSPDLKSILTTAAVMLPVLFLFVKKKF